MTKKELTTDLDQKLPLHWQASSDEINLRELILILWRQKLLILFVMILFTCLGGGYAFLAPQQWSTKAVIVEPKSGDLLSMQKIATQAMLLGLSGFPDGKNLFQEFVQEFNSYDNKRAFLKSSPFFTEQVKSQDIDEKGQRRLLRDWGELVNAVSVNGKSNDTEILITFSAPRADESLNMLKGYINHIIKLQQHQLIQRLGAQRDLQLEEMHTSYTMMQEDAKRALQQEISEIVLANSVAKAAGVSMPLERTNSQERFSISLGSKGLEEKLNQLKAIDLIVYQPGLQNIKSRINRLRHVSLEGISFRPFSYLDAPEEPLSRDKPKRPLVVVLATLLGGMLGVGVVLVRHAFRRPEQV
ncbi:hypothetical protein WP7S18E06_14600 [Aeromonas hydrophila]|uniref:LPS O-antigen chain length determinant protein WzzB n=1 Tax=Aeromonas hydrophila TaxID=644 RepID=UPI0015DBDC60|nr:Wzz/FepE/Etk N-terminal domain-containing protein [Aeromonas hydrophila]BBT05961.1 hypothetical protein WP7S18E06_14600 [Aeromonas hydrophila]